METGQIEPVATRFAGDKKVGESVLTRLEMRFKQWAVPKIPAGIETYHLTMLTLLWSGVNVGLAYWAKQDLRALWLVSLMIALQYVTDLFDGELGRQRRTGLIKWGFYMDHFLDYLFLCSLVFVGYKISPPGLETWYFILLVILGAYMVNSFLSFAATNKFEIYHYGIGPTETRIVFILVNAGIVWRGTANFDVLLPTTVVVLLAGLVLNTWQIQSKLWAYDMRERDEIAK